MILAEQHQPGGWKEKTQSYTPTCEWPETCLVQWGDRGIVLATAGTGKDSYLTAFFEAFPEHTFIRGEGKDIAEAEQKAFAFFQKTQVCPGHEFERRGYTNGAGFCKHCNFFKGAAFEPTEECVVCGVKTYYCQRDKKWYCKDHAPAFKFPGEDDEID